MYSLQSSWRSCSLPWHSDMIVLSLYSQIDSGVSADEDDDDGDNYLHPSLFASKKCSRLEELMKVFIHVKPVVRIAYMFCMSSEFS